MKRYKTVMDNIELTDAMKRRVMNNVITALENDVAENDTMYTDSNIPSDSDTDFDMDINEKFTSPSSPKKNTHRFKIYRYVATAACLILILTMGILYHRHQQNIVTPDTPDSDDFVLSGNNIQEVASLDELSKAMGFDIETPQYLPFTPSEIHYLSYWGDMAEINYSDGSNNATFRKAVGSDDISGDYNNYANVKICQISDTSVTLKGSSDGYSLAIWQKDNYTYALSLSEEISENEWGKILESIQ